MTSELNRKIRCRSVHKGYVDRQPEQLALEIDVSRLRAGSYSLHLRDAAGRSEVRRVAIW